MTSSAAVSVLGPEFNDFLFALIDEDKNGVPLSVLSALTRLQVDPWQEAAKLVHLPEETAIQRMASLIVALPDGPSVHPTMIAVRLIALLPRGTRSNMPSRQALLRLSSASSFRVAIYVIFMFFVLGTQSFIVSRQSAQVGSAQAPVSSTVTAQAPPWTFGP